MKSFFSFLIFLITIYANAENDTLPKLEKGVSYSLAQYRKSCLSNIDYNLTFTLSQNKKESIFGKEKLIFKYDKKTPDPLQIDFKSPISKVYSISVNGHQNEASIQKEHLIISGDFLINGQNEIEIHFIAGETSLNRHEDYLYTLFVPDKARTLFPCFDQPNLKATFSLSLILPSSWKTISNGSIIEQKKLKENNLFVFKKSDTISTYLFGFAAGKFNEVNENLGNQKIFFLHRETDTSKINNCLYPIFKHYKQSIFFCEDYTAIQYPFQQYGMVAIPNFQFGGMEHPGNILFQNSTLFVDKNANQTQINSRANLIAHEVAHQWFGDLVTMDWFSDVWMKEVFANFMADKINSNNESKKSYNLKFTTTHFPDAYSVDRTIGSNPIRQKLDNLANAGMLYGPIIYHKAPIMMQQLEILLGEEKFRNGIRIYLKKYANSNASWPDLIQILNKQTDKDLQKWNQVWVNETGRPVVNYQLHKNYLTISQKSEIGQERKIWPQTFDISFYYKNRVVNERIYDSLNAQQIKINHSSERPIFILMNASGIGYGVFQIDKSVYQNFDLIKDSSSRASAYISFYENMLNHHNFNAQEILLFYSQQLQKETTELNLKLITNYINNIFWQFIKPKSRAAISASLESSIWKAINIQKSANNKKILLETLENIFLSNNTFKKLYQIWKEEKNDLNIPLNDEDYSNLVIALSIRSHNNKILLEEQVGRIKNPDRLERFKIIMQAASSDLYIRNNFFDNLSKKENRHNESAISAALYYLHHPLRQESAVHYLPKTLDLLQEVKETGDIFFPDNWLRSTFYNYQSSHANEIVQHFLNKHPKYNTVLRNKILQATDNLKRAQIIAQ